MTISGGSALPKDEIERMIRDAEQHAEEDKAHRESTEARNTAEQMVYSTEQFLTESGEKVPAETREPVDTALTDLKDAIKPDSGASVDDIKAKTETLSTASQAMGSALMAAQAEVDAQDAAQAAEGDAAADSSSNDDVVDAEVVEDDEQSK